MAEARQDPHPHGRRGHARAPKQALLAGVRHTEQLLDDSIEREKEKNDFLDGVPAIVEAMRSGQIECRVYRRTSSTPRPTSPTPDTRWSAPRRWSAPATSPIPGLTDNIELNVQMRREVELLQEWYERHWDEAEDITPRSSSVIERHIREYTPFEVYAKALQEFFRGHELTAGEWENTESEVYAKLDQYQKEGYQALMKIARQLRRRVPLRRRRSGQDLRRPDADRAARRARAQARGAVRPQGGPQGGLGAAPAGGTCRTSGAEPATSATWPSSTTPTCCAGGEYPERLERIREMADAIVIDEAHHFRNPGVRAEEEEERRSRYWQLFDICAGKQVFMLTATPVNNRLLDLQHMIELFSQQDPGHFKAAPLGIHSLPGLLPQAREGAGAVARPGRPGGSTATSRSTRPSSSRVLAGDELFRELVVQRSRAYVQESQKKHGGPKTIFPKRETHRSSTTR